MTETGQSQRQDRARDRTETDMEREAALAAACLFPGHAYIRVYKSNLHYLENVKKAVSAA